MLLRLLLPALLSSSTAVAAAPARATCRRLVLLLTPPAVPRRPCWPVLPAAADPQLARYQRATQAAGLLATTAAHKRRWCCCVLTPSLSECCPAEPVPAVAVPSPSSAAAHAGCQCGHSYLAPLGLPPVSKACKNQFCCRIQRDALEQTPNYVMPHEQHHDKPEYGPERSLCTMPCGSHDQGLFVTGVHYPRHGPWRLAKIEHNT